MRSVFLLFVVHMINFCLVSGNISNEDVLDYLQDYGYVNSDKLKSPKGNSESSSIYSSSNARIISQGIAQFQLFNHLNVTGELNDETLNFMNRPRCGLRDIYHEYTLLGSKWPTRKLTYAISSYPTTLSKADVQYIIHRAFKIWTQYANLEIDPAAEGQRAHFRVSFSYGRHGDFNPFDGPNGVLAHASGPPYGGEVHFDASENWTKDSATGIDLYQVAVHEIGHALGLGHSNRPKSVMGPYYSSNSELSDLYPDDIFAIQALYGRRTHKEIDDNTVPDGNTVSSEEHGSFESRNATASSPKGTTKVPPRSTTESTPESTTHVHYGRGVNADLCNYSKIDGIFDSSNGVINVIQSDLIWALKGGAVLKNYPVAVSTQFRGPRGCINAVFKNRKNITFVFQGSQYWKYGPELIPLSHLPKEISRGFPGIPNNFDAVFSFSNGTAFFFKGSLFWKFDSSRRPPVTSDYPMPISQFWKNVPNYLDAVFYLSDETIYFFKDDMYYKWTSELAAVDPSYPKIIGEEWFGCDLESPEDGSGEGSKTDKPNSDNTVTFPCANSTVDAIFTMSNGSKYIFTGSRFWMIDATGNVLKEYPKLISEQWPQLPSKIDAAFSDETGLIYFFKGNQYWVSQNDTIRADFPKKIETTFSEVPGNLDAALFHHDLYLFKDDKVWIVHKIGRRFDTSILPMFYTMVFNGMPRNIDAAYVESDDLYLLKGTSYFKVTKPYFMFWSNHHLIQGSIADLFMCKQVLEQRFSNQDDYEYGDYDGTNMNKNIAGDGNFELL